MIVQFTQTRENYPDLTPGQPYFVIGIEADDYRILNDHGQPYLYPANLFKIIDATEPSDWITEYGDDGERYSYPQAINQTGFFEDFFDGQRGAISEFWHVVNRRLSNAA